MLKVTFENNKNIMKVFGTIEKILSKNKEDNKLKFVKLEKVNNKLKIIARNTYSRLNYLIDVASIEGDSDLYECKTLISLLNVLNGEITIDNGVIKNNKCKYKVPVISTEGYPDDILPTIINKQLINSQLFKQALLEVIPATSKIEGILSGIYIDKDKLVTCDQNRIFTKNINCDITPIIIPKELALDLLKLPLQDEIFISNFGNQIIFEDENILITNNMINGKYPLYEAIMPKQKKYEIIINNKEFESALNMIMPILNTTTMLCELTFTNNSLNIKGINGTNEGDTTFAVKTNFDEEVKVKFDARYLLDMLKASDEEIKLYTYLDNIGYKFISKDAWQYIMPIMK